MSQNKNGCLKFVLGSLIVLTIIMIAQCPPDKRTDRKKVIDNAQSSTTDESISPTKYGKVGKYSYSYFTKGAFTMVTFNGRGVNISNSSTPLEMTATLMTISTTVNSVSGSEKIELKDLESYTTEGKWIILKGKNCNYKTTFVRDGKYITDLIFCEN